MSKAPKIATVLGSLKVCCASKDLERGRKIHAEAIQCGLVSDIKIANSLINMYVRCGILIEAREIFLGMPRHSVISWTALILGYAVNGESALALALFDTMKQQRRIAPSSYTFVAALVAIASLAARFREEQDDDRRRKGKNLSPWLEKTMQIHAKAKTDPHLCFSSTLVDAYSKCQSMIDARAVFDRMPCHDVVAWTALILGYVENGDEELALDLLQAMELAPNSRTFVAALMACASLGDRERAARSDNLAPASLERGIAIHARATAASCDSNIFVANTAVDMLARCGSLDRARCAFERMTERTAASWNAIIRGYAELGDPAAALDLLARMERDHKRNREHCPAPDARSFSAALLACGSLGSLEAGRAIHARIPHEWIERDVILRNRLVDFYGRCGSMGDAEEIFAMARERSFESWNAMLAGYSRLGDARNALRIFDAMQGDGFRPDALSFVSILAACSHAGFVDRGKELFASMLPRHGIAPEIEHYHCVIDLLARSNRVEEAVAMVRSMPFAPRSVTWRTVLAACRKWQRVQIGELAFLASIELEPRNRGVYLLMAGIYATAGMGENRDRVLAAMREIEDGESTPLRLDRSAE